jgi:hypothetical protein
VVVAAVVMPGSRHPGASEATVTTYPPRPGVALTFVDRVGRAFLGVPDTVMP